MTMVLRVLSFRSVGPVLYGYYRNGNMGRTTRGKRSRSMVWYGMVWCGMVVQIGIHVQGASDPAIYVRFTVIVATTKIPFNIYVVTYYAIMFNRSVHCLTSTRSLLKSSKPKLLW